MTRGYLSLRIDDTNPAHHLFVNKGGRSNGFWWVASTLHFDGRKRRVRKPLGTKSLDEAIRRRDALFARIQRDGEEVPERRRKGPGDGEMRRNILPVMLALPPRSSVWNHLPMRIDDNLRHRVGYISAADAHVMESERLTALPVDASDESARQWRRVAKFHDMAASSYHRAGLGMLAVAAWQGAAKCYDAAGMPDDAKQLRTRAAALPTYDVEDFSGGE